MFLFDIPIHKFLIHFPIALTIIALIYDSWAVYSRKPELHRLEKEADPFNPPDRLGCRNRQDLVLMDGGALFVFTVLRFD